MSLFISLFSLFFLLSCAPISEPVDIDFHIANPSFVMNYDKNFYVLNSNALKKYKTGSVIALNENGDIWGAVPVDNGGTSMVRIEDLLAISFCPEQNHSYINLYRLNENGLPLTETFKSLSLLSLLGNRFGDISHTDEQRPRIKEMFLTKGNDGTFHLVLELGGASKVDGIVFAKLSSQGDLIDHFNLEETFGKLNDDKLAEIFPIKAEKPVYIGDNKYLIISQGKNVRTKDLNGYRYLANPLEIESNPISTYYLLKNIPGLRAGVWDPVNNSFVVLKSQFKDNKTLNGAVERFSGLYDLFETTQLSEQNTTLKGEILNNSIPADYLEKVLFSKIDQNSLFWASYKEGPRRKENVYLHALNFKSPTEIPTVKFSHEGTVSIAQSGNLFLGASYIENSLELWSYSPEKHFSKLWEK